ncbi:sialate O-acetylesterase [Mucilaginibacter gracilis]|uniref:Sialate O-acetylesterase n=1 Tax=Mucilaginibacter gracilis TaxID=423350 RepID=A0A495IVB0_9SPHI|nr:sialate O-acetylesterase [Mucilaginibacter gracilis]RKR79938.1 sialate O-acetylesterase [Mucilaginibacter gracilis]
MKHYRSLLTIILFTFKLGVGGANAQLVPEGSQQDPVKGLSLAKIFSSNMVLQQGKANAIWGFARQGEAVTIHFAGKVIKTKAGTDGKWKTILPVMDYGGPYTMRIEGDNRIELTNIMIGEVWACTGQSNMGLQVSSVDHSEQEIAGANYPKIRLFSVPSRLSQFPQDDLEGGHWVECSPATVGKFSGVGYFFGRALHQRLNVAIGLISSNVGGTSAEIWSSPDNMLQDPDFSGPVKKLQSIDLVKQKQDRVEHITRFAGEFPTKDKGLLGGVAVYAAPNLDISTWSNLQVPAAWDPLFVGVGWSRKEFMLTKEEALQPIEIHLSRIDDDDISYINGEQIGATLNVGDRVYRVPAQFLKEGRNLLTVRILNRSGIGGMCGKAEDMFILSSAGKQSLAGTWKFKLSEILQHGLDIQKNDYPTILYNGMISPLIPFGIRGIIWYQGEGNAGRAQQYARIFPNLIRDWRAHWGLGDIPFLFVSLANYTRPPLQPSESSWAEIREVQTATLALPNTAMAIAMDTGDGNLHPPNKQDVGARLALDALATIYHQHVVYSGPLYKSMAIVNGVAQITFNTMGSRLQSKDGDMDIRGFAVAGSDHHYYWAKAKITGDNTISVWSEEVKEPLTVRYAWADNPGSLNLYNDAGLPAIPFRTDNPIVIHP